MDGIIVGHRGIPAPTISELARAGSADRATQGFLASEQVLAVAKQYLFQEPCSRAALSGALG